MAPSWIWPSSPQIPDYAAVMARLVASPKPPPPGRWSKWRRSINKKLGRPATPDVGTLADMLASLRDAAGASLGTSLDRVAVTSPPIAGLADYDMLDALQHANLRPWLAATSGLPYSEPEPPFYPAGQYPEELSEAYAVMGAYGIGMCKRYWNVFGCDEENSRRPTEKVMVVGITEVDLMS
ncbi:hypothetical protein ACJ41O_011047 [Fusarium nematophilum]